MGTDPRRIRTTIGRAVWLVCVVLALILATGALLISLRGSGTSPEGSWYMFVVDAADKADFAVLSRRDGLFDFVGKDADSLDALANWGLAAILWLVIGRVADRVVRG